jgi:hypothetical protein
VAVTVTGVLEAASVVTVRSAPASERVTESGPLPEVRLKFSVSRPPAVRVTVLVAAGAALRVRASLSAPVRRLKAVRPV